MLAVTSGETSIQRNFLILNKQIYHFLG
uniref:Uncharacterized protein n=1 Tax=Rhizophora mucronata TaxID=61149 RepID=A0A2P2QD60_RHIMU